VIMRFDLEQELLDGRLAPAELPDTWRARFQADLGNTPADDREGV
jgi:carboxypeptidase Taq